METEMDKTNLEQTSACCREDANGLTAIRGFTICTNGLVGGYRGPRQPVRPDQVEIVKEFLSKCRRTRWARELLSPLSCDLKHWVEDWAGRYISTGAAIVAALELGLVVAPYKNGPNALIGVPFEDVCERMAERGWHLTRYTYGRIKPAPEPKPPLPRSYWQKLLKELGIKIADEAEEC
jgi:hypothetical protein